MLELLDAGTRKSGADCPPPDTIRACLLLKATVEGGVGITFKAPADVASFSEFYRKQYHPAVALAFAITGDRPAAEDVTQEAFITAQKRWTRVGHYDARAQW